MMPDRPDEGRRENQPEGLTNNQGRPIRFFIAVNQVSGHVCARTCASLFRLSKPDFTKAATQVCPAHENGAAAQAR